MEHKKHHQEKKAVHAPNHAGHSGAEMARQRQRYYPEPVKKEHIHPTHMRQGQEPEKKHEYTRQQY